MKLAITRSKLKKSVWFTAALLVLAVLGLHLVCQYIGTLDLSRGRFSSYFHHPVILFMNALPIALVMALSFCVFNRAWAAYLLTGTLALLMEFVNYFKIQVRGDPFVIDDLSAVNEALGLMDQIQLKIPTVFYLSIGLLIGGTVVLALIAKAKVPKRLWWTRLAGLGLCLVLCAGAWFGLYTNRELYTSQQNYYFFSGDRDSEYRASHGFFWSFLRSIDEAAPSVPEGYSDEAALAELNRFTDGEISDKVNIMITMLESYADFTPYVEFEIDPYVEFHALQEESFSGILLSDTIGGGTVNAERSLLTGYSFPHPLYRSNSASFVRYFASQGYTVEGGHPGFAWYYSRQVINRLLGFASYDFMENHYEQIMDERLYNEHPNDALFFEDRLAAFADRDPAKPYFSFSITYQNHCPYVSDGLIDKEYVAQGELSDEAYYLFNNYIAGIADTGKQMAAYVDAFRDSTAPVVLMFFGDHKPALGTENSVYGELGINIAEGTADGYYNLYTTPYLIWANDAAKAILGDNFHGTGDTISPCYLMSELFDRCGWQGNAWMQYQRKMRQELPIITERPLVLQEDGTLEISESTAEAKAQYKIVEHYIRKQTPD